MIWLVLGLLFGVTIGVLVGGFLASASRGDERAELIEFRERHNKGSWD